MHARHLIPLCSAAFLVACAGAQTGQTPTAADVGSAPATPSPQTAPAPPQAQPIPPVRDRVRAVPEAPPDPGKLIGLAPDSVDKLLGKPNLVRRDGPAEIRLYSGGTPRCTFHIFLYARGVAGQPSRVEYFEARNEHGRLEGTDLADCYRALIKPAATS